jgi:hypothetical protein
LRLDGCCFFVSLTYRLTTRGLVPNEEMRNCTTFQWQLSRLPHAACSQCATENTGARKNPAVETKARSANFDCWESWQQAIKRIWPPFYLCCEQNQNSFVRMAWCLFIVLKLRFVESVRTRHDHLNAINFHVFCTSEVFNMWEQEWMKTTFKVKLYEGLIYDNMAPVR